MELNGFKGQVDAANAKVEMYANQVSQCISFFYSHFLFVERLSCLRETNTLQTYPSTVLMASNQGCVIHTYTHFELFAYLLLPDGAIWGPKRVCF